MTERLTLTLLFKNISVLLLKDILNRDKILLFKCECEFWN